MMTDDASSVPQDYYYYISSSWLLPMLQLLFSSVFHPKLTAGQNNIFLFPGEFSLIIQFQSEVQIKRDGWKLGERSYAQPKGLEEWVTRRRLRKQKASQLEGQLTITDDLNPQLPYIPQCTVIEAKQKADVNTYNYMLVITLQSKPTCLASKHCSCVCIGAYSIGTVELLVSQIVILCK